MMKKYVKNVTRLDGREPIMRHLIIKKPNVLEI